MPHSLPYTLIHTSQQ